MPEKIYTEAEISALLGRAARLQAAGEPSGHEGLTLEEIKAAAAEAGIDPRFVELASSASSDHGTAQWSIPTGVGRSLVVQGSLTDDRWSRIVAECSRAFGGPGQTEEQGMRRSWSRGSLRVTAEEMSDRIALHAETEWGTELELPIALTLVGAVAAATTGALALVSLEWTIGVVAALLAIVVVGSFSAYRSRTVKKQERLRSTFASTLDRCAAILQEDEQAEVDADRPPQVQAKDPATELIELPEMDDSERITREAGRRTRA